MKKNSLETKTKTAKKKQQYNKKQILSNTQVKSSRHKGHFIAVRNRCEMKWSNYRANKLCRSLRENGMFSPLFSALSQKHLDFQFPYNWRLVGPSVFFVFTYFLFFFLMILLHSLRQHWLSPSLNFSMQCRVAATLPTHRPNTLTSVFYFIQMSSISTFRPLNWVFHFAEMSSLNSPTLLLVILSLSFGSNSCL